jgi:hypothetical protein
MAALAQPGRQLIALRGGGVWGMPAQTERRVHAARWGTKAERATLTGVVPAHVEGSRC